MNHYRNCVLSFLTALALIAATSAGEIRLVSWNVESGGADPETIAEEITEFDGYDVWGLCEVNAQDAPLYAEAAGDGEWSESQYVLGDTGGSDRMLIAWNPAKVEMLETLELTEFQAQTGRAPLVAKFKERPSGPQFWFMINHLHRGSPAKRMEQTLGVRGWMSQQTAPVFAMGDWNYDYSVPDGPGNAAFEAMSQGHGPRWIRPTQLVRTQSSFNSVLDMLWVNEGAVQWSPRSRIIQRENDFVPVSERSDHRPVDARFNTETTHPEGAPLASRVRLRAFIPRASTQTAIAVEPARPVHAPPPVVANAVNDEFKKDVLRKIEAIRKQLAELEAEVVEK